MEMFAVKGGEILILRLPQFHFENGIFSSKILELYSLGYICTSLFSEVYTQSVVADFEISADEDMAVV